MTAALVNSLFSSHGTGGFTPGWPELTVGEEPGLAGGYGARPASSAMEKMVERGGVIKWWGMFWGSYYCAGKSPFPTAHTHHQILNNR